MRKISETCALNISHFRTTHGAKCKREFVLDFEWIYFGIEIINSEWMKRLYNVIFSLLLIAYFVLTWWGFSRSNLIRPFMNTIIPKSHDSEYNKWTENASNCQKFAWEKRFCQHSIRTKNATFYVIFRIMEYSLLYQLNIVKII